MAQLSLVIGSILRDIILAQHEANLYSLALSESYGEDGIVKGFQLPNVMIGDMELELKYGINSTSASKEQFNIKYHKFRRFLKDLCEQAAQVAISSAVSTVITEDLQEKNGGRHFFERLETEMTLQHEFCAFLSRNMRNAFRYNLYEAISTSEGTVKKEVVLNKLTDVIRKKFLYDTDLDDLFSGPEGIRLREQTEKNVQTAMEAVIEKLSKDANFKKTRLFPELDVAVTADELMDMPEEAIHSFKLKFNPRDYSIGQLDDDETEENFVMY